MTLVEYAEFLVKSICKNPDMVKVTSFESEEGVTLEVIVHSDDKGTVIGKGGTMINSIRTLINAKTYLENLPRVKINVESF